MYVVGADLVREVPPPLSHGRLNAVEQSRATPTRVPARTNSAAMDFADEVRSYESTPTRAAGSYALRRTLPGDTPIQRLNARLNAASDW